MNEPYPRVPLGEVLFRRKDITVIEDFEEYKRLTIRMKGGGIVLRDTLTGNEIGTKRQFTVSQGQLLLSKIDARNGAFGVVPKECDGAIITGNFWTFDANRDVLDIRYLNYLTRTKLFVDSCIRASEGTTNRLYLQEDLFLAQELPLPPLSEQQRIVARIEELAARIEEARGLRRQAVEEAEALRRAIIFDPAQEKAKPTKMNELVSLRQPDVSVVPHEAYHFAGVYSFGRGVFRGDVKTGMEFRYPRLTRVSEGNFIYPKLMAWEGALGIVPKECDGLMVSPEFPVFEVDESKVLPETLDVYFRTASVWPQLSGTSTGTNVRRRRLNPKTFLDYEFPLPSMAAQKQLREITDKLNPLKMVQAETAAELDALLPSVLDRAFKGRL
jgi:type I restriction enzyme S subunit